jgi:hypothetical protein
MNASVHLKHLERRISLDPISDANWLRTKLESGHIVESMRFTDADIAKYGLEQVKAWIEEDHRRLRGFEDGDWWFVDLQVVAVLAVMLDDRELGQIDVLSACVGGIESDCPQCHISELTQDLVGELKTGLRELGFTDADGVAIVDA